MRFFNLALFLIFIIKTEQKRVIKTKIDEMIGGIGETMGNIQGNLWYIMGMMDEKETMRDKKEKRAR